MAEIAFRNVTKRYGSVLAVDDASFTVADNEVFCFFGPPLSGKIDHPTPDPWPGDAGPRRNPDRWAPGEPAVARPSAMSPWCFRTWPCFRTCPRPTTFASRWSSARWRRPRSAGGWPTSPPSFTSAISCKAAGAALRRRAPARRDRARPGARSGRLSDGRSDLRARCAPARGDSRRAQAHPARARQDPGLCHPRPGGGDVDRRPDGYS